MRYLTLNDVLELYRQVMEQAGGTVGIRDLEGVFISCVASGVVGVLKRYVPCRV